MPSDCLCSIGLLLGALAMAASSAAQTGAPTQGGPPKGVTRYDIEAAPQPLVRADPPDNPYAREYEFNPDLDWFSPNVPVWNAAMAEFKDHPGLRYLEIGCFEGRSAVWMLENVLTGEGSTLTCIDPYQAHVGEEVKQRFLANVETAGASGRVTLIVGFSQEQLRPLPLDSFDIIYIDGDHRAAPVLEDAVLSWRLLKVGGLMIFDDYDWEITRPAPDRPLMGADFFTEAFRDKVEVMHRDYQLILRKTANY